MGPTPQSRRWGIPIACGVLVASLIVLPRAVAESQSTQQFSFQFELATSVPAVVELYVDRGRGLRVDDRLIASNPASDLPLAYQFPLLTGAYRAIRIDPFPAAGSLTIAHARIVDRYNNVVETLALDGADASALSEVREVSVERLAARTDRADPRIVFEFASPRLLWLAQADFRRHAGLFLILATFGALLASAIDRVLPPSSVRPPTEVGHAVKPRVMVAALLGTVVSVYPLLFGRSLVTPNNGPVRFHYASSPYVAGADDVFVESARGQDIPAAMFSTLPLAKVQREALAHGEWPFWNRYAFNGVPLLGQGQSAFFDPLQWLTLIDDLAIGADLKFAAGRLVFAIGMGVATLAATHSAAGAVFAAFAAPFVGHFEWKVNHPGYFSVVYAPWVLVAFFGLRRAHSWAEAARSGLILLAATALVMFSSPPKETLLVIAVTYSTGALALLLPPFSETDRGTTAMRVAMVGIGVVGAALLSAPQWLVFFETLGGAGTLYDQPVIEFGNLTQAAWFLLIPFGIGVIFPGINPLLAGLAIVQLRSIRRWLATPCVSATTIAALLWLALGYGALPAAWLVRLPFVGNIHHFSTSVSSAIAPLFLVLSAAGVATIVRRWPIPRMEALVAGTALAGITAALLALGVDLASPGLGFALTACVWMGVCLYLMLRIADGEPSRVGKGVLSVAGAILLVAGGLHFETGSTELDAVLLQPRVRARLEAVPPEMEPSHHSPTPQRVAGSGGVLAGSVPQFQLLETITGVDALFPANTWALGGRFTTLYPMAMGDGTDADLQRSAALLDLWNVGWIFRPATGGGPHRLEAISRATAWPRAFFAAEVERYGDIREFVGRLTSDSRPFAAVEASDPRTATASPSLVARTTAAVVAADAYRLTPNTTSFVVHAPSAGIVVLNENYWPGVTAIINGKRGDVFPVNFTMRGVAIPSAGRYEITFAYRPQTWTTAAALAVGGLVVIALLSTVAVRPAITRRAR